MAKMTAKLDALGIRHSRLNAVDGDALVFRSARSDSESPSFNDPEEFLHELIAEFLWNGDRIRVGGPRSGGVAPSIVARLEDAIRSLLDHCVGHIIFDYYG